MALVNSAHNLIGRAVTSIGKVFERSGLKAAKSIGKASKPVTSTISAASKSKSAPLAKDTVEIAGKKSKKRDIKSFIKKRFKAIKRKSLGLDKTVVEKLEKMQPQEFLEESRNIIAKALNIPEGLKPNILFGEIPGRKIGAFYEPTTNIIVVSKKLQNIKRNNLFAIIST